jgi:hypothetical protein
MKKSSFIIVMLLFSTLFGCGEKCKKRDTFIEFEQMMPSMLMNFFPENICRKNVNVNVLYPAVLDHNLNYCGCFVSDKMDNNSYNLLLKECNPIENYDFIYLKQKNDASKINVIPLVSEQYSPFNKFNLSVDIQHVVFESGEIPIAETEISLQNHKEVLKYSKGYVYDYKNEIIVYWLVLW